MNIILKLFIAIVVTVTLSWEPRFSEMEAVSEPISIPNLQENPKPSIRSIETENIQKFKTLRQIYPKITKSKTNAENSYSSLSKTILELAYSNASFSISEDILPQNPQSLWIHIVCGEGGGGWPEGNLLVAWTMRAWQIHFGFRADQFGPEIGWYGYCDNPDYTARDAVRSAYDAPLSSSPFEFMRAGQWCRHLGSESDRIYWLDQKWFSTDADIVISHPRYERYKLNCWFSQK